MDLDDRTRDGCWGVVASNAIAVPAVPQQGTAGSRSSVLSSLWARLWQLRSSLNDPSAARPHEHPSARNIFRTRSVEVFRTVKLSRAKKSINRIERAAPGPQPLHAPALLGGEGGAGQLELLPTEKRVAICDEGELFKLHGPTERES